MKKTDIAMIVFIASISLLVAYFVGQLVIGNTTEKGETVKTIQPIQSSVGEVDQNVFSPDAINPTVQINVSAATDQ